MSLYLKCISALKSRTKFGVDLVRKRYFLTVTTNFAKAQNNLDDPNKPIEFLKSDAAKWKAQVSRTGVSEEYPWYQTYVILASLSVFMIYFFILREESDIDLEFGRSLYDRIEGLEEKQLEIVMDYNKDRGIPYVDEQKRLEELREEHKKQ